MLYFHPFFKITDPCDGRSFLVCSHDPFFGTNKNRTLKNESCERALRLWKLKKDDSKEQHSAIYPKSAYGRVALAPQSTWQALQLADIFD